MKIPELTAISWTRHDMKWKACFEGKIKRAGHKCKEHKYKRGEAFSSNIMGPLNIPDLPVVTERYFISFLDVASRYTYVVLLDVQSQTPTFINRFLENVKKVFGQAQMWFIASTLVNNK